MSFMNFFIFLCSPPPYGHLHFQLLPTCDKCQWIQQLEYRLLFVQENQLWGGPAAQGPALCPAPLGLDSSIVAGFSLRPLLGTWLVTWPTWQRCQGWWEHQMGCRLLAGMWAAGQMGTPQVRWPQPLTQQKLPDDSGGAFLFLALSLFLTFF